MSADHSEWVTYQLGDVGKVLTGKTPPGTEDKYFNGKTLFVTPTDMGNHREITETQRTLSTEGENVLYRVVFERGIVVSCIGWQMGKSAIIKKKSATNQQINTVLPDEGKIDFDFLYYVLSLKRKEIFDLGATCTRTPILKKSAFEKITFKAPGINEQRAIAGILSSFDDKIELNRQVNQALEEIAQAIFKSWFVDFEPVKAKIEAKANGQDPECAAMCAISGKTDAELDQLPPDQLAQLRTTADLFPDELTDSELGLIPKGWEYSTIGKEVDVVGGGTPSTKNPVFWDNGTFHWTTPKDLSGNQDKILLNTERKITEAGLGKISSGILPISTVLLSSRAPVGYLALAKVPVAVNQGYIAMKCTKKLPPVYVLQWASSVMDDIKQRASGTTFAEISKKNFRIIPVLVPTETLLTLYRQQVNCLYDKITESISEMATLAELRDSLLPQLLSGKIDLTGTVNV